DKTNGLQSAGVPHGPRASESLGRGTNVAPARFVLSWAQRGGDNLGDPVVSLMRHSLSRVLARVPRLATHMSIAAIIALASPVGATWKPEYANQPFEVQQWYRNAELTRAAQTRFPFKKCCDHSDVVKTKFNVNKTSAGDEWYWLDGDKWRRIPDD